MGFVKDHGAGFGEDAGIRRIIGLLFDAKIGKEQMMVHDDDVALRRAPPHLGDETFLPNAAFLPEAGLGPRIQLVPERAGFGERRQFGPVACLRGFLPRGNGAVVVDFLQPAEYGLVGQVVEFLAAKIIAASLHVTDAQPVLAVGEERLLKEWNILMKKLFLQILSPG